MFIQREEELEAIARLFREGARIVSLTGTAGVGKTRLMREWLPDDGLFVDLSDARSQDDIESKLYEALEAPHPHDNKSARLRRVIADRGEIVIGLDNFEQVVSHAGATVGKWIRGTRARFLVTSRERLGLRQENAVVVLPLGLPGDGDVQSAPAVRLLLGRAAELAGGFQIQEDEADAVSAIVHRLDGLPLALELAAAPLAEMGALRLQRELEDGAGASAAGRDVLAATVAWSWELLDEQHRRALAACSVFQGGFDLSSAEAVLDLERTTTVDLLQSLFNKSLIHTPAAGRFAIYQSIKRFALAKLDDDVVRRRHAVYFSEFGTRRLDDINSDDAYAGWQSLRRERHNIGLAAEHDDSSIAAKAVDTLTRLFAIEGASERDMSRVERAIAASTQSRARMMAHHGRLLHDRGRVDEAGIEVEKAAELAKATNDPWAEARALLTLSRVNLHRGKTTRAVQLLEESAVPAARASRDPVLLGATIAMTGIAVGAMADVKRAVALLEEALKLFQESNAVREESLVLASLGFWHASQGRGADALLAAARAEAIQERIGAKADGVYSAYARGMTLLLLRNYVGAQRAFGRGLRNALRYGTEIYLTVLHQGAALSKVLGNSDIVGARHDAARSLEAARASGDLRSKILSGLLVGYCELRQGSKVEAASYFDEATGLAESAGYPVFHIISDLYQAHLDPERLAHALARTREIGPDGNPYIDVNLDIRLHARLHEGANPASSVAVRGGGASQALVVDLAGGLFLPPGAVEPIDIRRRNALRLILHALVEVHDKDAERYLSLAELGTIGWPDSPGSPATMSNRVRVAIATLRKLGLETNLVSRKGGYRLLPTLKVQGVSRLSVADSGEGE